MFEFRITGISAKIRNSNIISYLLRTSNVENDEKSKKFKERLKILFLHIILWKYTRFFSIFMPVKIVKKLNEHHCLHS